MAMTIDELRRLIVEGRQGFIYVSDGTHFYAFREDYLVSLVTQFTIEQLERAKMCKSPMFDQPFNVAVNLNNEIIDELIEELRNG